MEEKRIVRRRGSFSDRNNIKPLSKELQFSDFDEKTRIKLKNFSFKLIEMYKKYYPYPDGRRIISSLFADWLNNDNVRNQLKYDIKVCLVKNGYQAKYSPDVFSQVMEQVENFEENK